MKWTRDHQWQLDNMSEPEEQPICECGEQMSVDLLGEFVCAECDAKNKKENDESRN